MGDVIYEWLLMGLLNRIFEILVFFLKKTCVFFKPRYVHLSHTVIMLKRKLRAKCRKIMQLMRYYKLFKMCHFEAKQLSALSIHDYIGPSQLWTMKFISFTLHDIHNFVEIFFKKYHEGKFFL